MAGRITTLMGQPRRLDGGAMFGRVPRQAWSGWLAPDHHNQVEVASRALLVQEDDQNILVVAGSEPLLAPLPRTCRCQQASTPILDGLAALGLGEQDIDVVLLTHLHAHLSAPLSAAAEEGELPRLLFPQATYLVGERHWFRARHPHPLDRGLFLSALNTRLEHSGRLELIDESTSARLGAGWRFQVSDGYTPGQLLPEIDLPGGMLIYAGDLVPGVDWLQLDVVSAYDRHPECSVNEREYLLDRLVAEGGRLVFARDPQVAMVKVQRDRQSRYQPFDLQAAIERLDS